MLFAWVMSRESAQRLQSGIAYAYQIGEETQRFDEWLNAVSMYIINVVLKAAWAHHLRSPGKTPSPLTKTSPRLMIRLRRPTV